jgi:hypothetical protein
MSRTNYIAPSPQSGYILNPMRGYLSVIEPEETENIIENPSVEFVTTGWTAVGGTIALSTAWQTSGANSLLVTPAAGVNDGAYYLQSTTINTRYTWSLDFRGTKGIKYSIRVYGVTGAATLVTSGFVSTGFLQNLHVGFDTGANTSVRAYVEKAGHTSVSPFYVDSMQIEAKAYATTHCNGDKEGCMWRGQPHASRSARSASSPGGRIRRLDQYGFQVLSISGLDMPPIQPSSTDYALQNGAVYQGYRATTRSITIVGTVGGARLDILQHRKHKLMELFKPNTPSSIPITFRYQAFDGCRAVGDEVEFSAVYAEGLEGVGNDNYQERLAIRFTLYDPLIYAVGDRGVTIDCQDILAPVATIIVGRINNQWGAMGVPAYAPLGGLDIAKIKIGPDGKLYVCGRFWNWDGVDGQDYIVRYDFVKEAWEPIGPLHSGKTYVHDFCWGPDGVLYVVGDFEDWVCGVAPFIAKHVVSWDGTNWVAVGTPHAGAAVITSVMGCAVSRNNVLWVGGNFSDFAGVGADALAYWDGSWHQGTTSADAIGASINTLALGPDDFIYAGILKVVKTNGPGAWEVVGTGINGSVEEIIFSPVGKCYIGGYFTTAGGYTAKYVAALDGTDWVPVGSPEDQISGFAELGGFALDSIGNLYIAFYHHTPVGFASTVVKWNGFSFVSMDYYTAPVFEGTTAIAIDGANNIFVSGAREDFGALAVAGATTVTKLGSADSYPVFEMLGPGSLYTIYNETTGEKLWFNLTLAANEKAILSLGNNPSFSSTFQSSGMFAEQGWGPYGPIGDPVITNWGVTGAGRGNIISTILPGSNLSSFHLAPGVNKITCLIAGTTDGNTSIKMYYKPTYWGVQDASGVHK